MSWKFYIKGNLFIAENEQDGEYIDKHRVWVSIRKKKVTDEVYTVYYNNNIVTALLKDIPLTDLRKENGSNWADAAEFEDWRASNLGFNLEGGTTPAAVINYTATNYTDLTTVVAPTANEGDLARVYNSQGVWVLGTRKVSGAYQYKSGNWVYASQDLQDEIRSNDIDIANLQANKTDKSINLTAGLGLSGGGDLSANRVFNIDVANSVEVQGTSVQLKNDEEAPENFHYYGTNANGNVGYHESGIVGKFNFDANISNVLYSDDFITLSWNSANKQPTYTIPPSTPLGGWFWHEVSVSLIQGSSQNWIGESGAVIPFPITFYFNQGGTLDTSFNMANYGASGFYSVMKETYVAGFPRYTMHLMIGNTGHGSVIIFKTN